MNPDPSLKTPSKARPLFNLLVIDILLCVVLLLGAFFRLVGIYWGEYSFMHPDERFLLMVGSAIEPVDSFSAYFDTANSTLNPNNRGYSFYVYGTLPMFLTRYVVEWVYGQSGLNEMLNVGRPLSALADLLVVFLVFLVGARTYNRRVGLVAAAFSALAVLQIQQSHFFTMDTFINLFTLLSIYFAVRVGTERREWGSTNFVRHPFFLLSIAFGISLGCAVASKLNALPVAIMLPAAFLLQLSREAPEQRQRRLIEALVYVGIAAFLSFWTFRVFQPYAFSGPGFFGIKPNPHWVATIQELRNQSAGDVDFPPAWQWARRSVWFSGKNLTLWGLGLPLGLLAWAGFIWIGWRILKGEWQKHSLLWGWTAFYFTWQSLQFNPTMRYQLPIYPTLAIFAGWVVVELYERGRAMAERGHVRALASRFLSILIGVVVILGTLAWAYAFSRIYVEPFTRIDASRWLLQNAPGPLTLNIQTDQEGYNQPISYPYDYEIYPGQTWETVFTANASGAVSQVYLPHILDRDVTGPTTDLTVVISQQPDGSQPLSTTTLAVPVAGESGLTSQTYVPTFSTPPNLVKDQVYYLVISLPAGAGTVSICGPVVVIIQGPVEFIDQTLPAPADCMVQEGVAYVNGFAALESGPLSNLYLNEVTNLTQPTEPQPKTLRLSLSPEGQSEPVSVARLTATLGTNEGEMAPGATMVFDIPAILDEGRAYRLALAYESGSSGLTLRGTGIASEGPWDDGLPLRVDNYDPFGGIYPREVELNMVWEDNPDKLAHMLDILNKTEFIAISSNRFWGTETRLSERFPLSTLYYRRLLGCPDERDLLWCYYVAKPGTFTGDLGFELVQVFQSDPSIGALRINDQVAEEAFTVYDHPKVLIFRKTADYNQEHVAEILGGADLSQVIHLTPKTAPPYPATLTLPPNRLSEQRNNGTWSELYDSRSLLNRFQPLGVLVWYLAVFLVGLIAYPIVRAALPGLPDHGYPMMRITGLLVLAYIVWLAGSARIPFSRTTITIVLLVLILFGLYLAYRQRGDLRQEIRSRWRYILLIEGLSLAFFAFFLLVRLGNPDVWHPYFGGEKPMEFSYFNAVLKSTSFPPYDPWYAGGSLNYYYWGYVLVGVLVKWLGIVPSFAYNLILPTLFSMVAMGAFSIAWNLIYKEDENGARIPRFAFASGLFASFGMVVLGNLGTLRMIWRGYQKIGIPGGLTADIGLIARLVGGARGMWLAVTGTSLPYSIGEWYWIPSRVIPAPGETEPITEFPYFSFIYADLHAHLMALPLALLALAWAISVVLSKGKWRDIGSAVLGFMLGGMAIGALGPTNTWDFYTYLAIGVVALGYAWMRYLDINQHTFSTTILARLPDMVKRILATAGGIGLLLGLAWFMYQPYRQWYGLGYSKIDLWKGTHTPLDSYLIHWGLFLFVIISWMVWEALDWMASTPLSALRKLEPYRGLIGFLLVLFVAVIVVLMLVLKVRLAWFILPLAAWAGILLLRPSLPDAKRLALFLVGTGLVLTLTVEVVVLRGDIARMNTVFKFYLQVWTLFAVSAAAGLGWLLSNLRLWQPRWRVAWQVVLALLIIGAGAYTVTASLAKVRDRMSAQAPHNLDGLIYMPYSTYAWKEATMDLSQDYRAIRWMQENVPDSPVIVEANSGDLYRWYTRYTINTGLPNPLGWEWHQIQQRALNPSEWVHQRLEEINQFYQTTDAGIASDFLQKYDIRYIIVGQLEKITYPGPGLDKFPAFNGVMWNEVYRDIDTVIYDVIQHEGQD